MHIDNIVSEIKKSLDLFGHEEGYIKIECSKLADKSYRDRICQSLTFPKHFSAVYWFEITNPEHTPLEIKRAAKAYKEKKQKPTPQIPVKDSQTNILYVGKSEGNFAKRIKEHLGCENNTTTSLQLRYWADKLNLELELHYVIFDTPQNKELPTLIMKKSLSIIEFSLAQELKPILGRHA